MRYRIEQTQSHGRHPQCGQHNPNTQCLAAHLPVCGANSNRENTVSCIASAISDAAPAGKPRALPWMSIGIAEIGSGSTASPHAAGHPNGHWPRLACILGRHAEC